MAERPNFLVILIDDLRFDEFGAGGHPYMKTPNVDRIAREGANCTRAFHPTPICSPNRASILTGQYASRHGVIDNVARDALSHRLPNYHVALQRLGYETAHVGKWHMGNDGTPRPGYDTWVSFDGHGSLVRPRPQRERDVPEARRVHDRPAQRARARIRRRRGTTVRGVSSSPTRRCIRTPSRPPTARSTLRTRAATGRRRATPISIAAPSSRAGRTCSRRRRW